MFELAWDKIIHGTRDVRTQKPRDFGLTMILDVGCGLKETDDILEYSRHLIDLWKLSFGTSAFIEKKLLQEKLQMLKEHDVISFPGGTLLEVALIEHHCRVFMRHAKELGFTAVEISDGTIPIPRFRRKNIIDCALNADLIPITEVGKKDPKHQPTVDQIAEEALEDLSWGAKWVIVEGRESGVSVGVYDKDGRVEKNQIERIAELMGDQFDRLIWEAPLKLQQTYLIENFGSNVSMGNINYGQILALEALRNGLRFETLQSVTDQLLRNGRWDPNEVEPKINDIEETAVTFSNKSCLHEKLHKPKRPE